MRGSLLQTELGEERKGLGPSQYPSCKHVFKNGQACGREVRMSWTGPYCLLHIYHHKEAIVKKDLPDDQVHEAWERTQTVAGTAAALSCSWGTAHQNLVRLGIEVPKRTKQRRRSGAAAAKRSTARVAPTMQAAALAPPAQPAPSSRSTSAALSPVPASAPMGGDEVLDQLQGVLVAAQQVVNVLRPLNDSARHQVLVLVGAAHPSSVRLQARGEG